MSMMIQIAIAVIVENGGHGSSAAAPVARKIVDLWMQKQVQTPSVNTQEKTNAVQ